MSVQSPVGLMEHAIFTIEICLPLWQFPIKRLSVSKLSYPYSNEDDIVW